MPDVAVNNTPVSISLAVGESTTVPSGETQRVTITASPFGPSVDANVVVKINGNQVAGASGGFSNNDRPGQRSVSFSTVLTEGDTITVDSGVNGGGAHIGGFVV